MNDPYGNVRNYYDADPEHEWNRFERHRFEFPVTLHYLDSYMQAEAEVLDIGGGPGRYSQALAKRGHTVDLFDLSPKSIHLARRLAREHGVNLRSYHAGNAVDLGRFPDNSYDTVLNMGPLYHLVSKEDREASISESVRVLRPGGILAVSFISSFAHIYDTLSKNPGAISEIEVLADGCRTSKTYLESERRHFTDGYVTAPFEVENHFSRYPLETLSIIGAEGVAAHNEAQICRSGEETIHAWVQLCTRIADTEAAIASSIHIVYFGRKV